MTCRYCPDCNRWYDTHEIDLSESGETMCPEDDHGYVTGSIIPSRHFEPDVNLPRGHEHEANRAASRQDLL